MPSSSRGKATTAERQGGAAQAQKAATSKPTVKRDEHGVPTGPKLKYSVLVQQAEGVCDTTLASYFAQWGVVVSVKKLADSHGFVTFNSAASVVALLDRPPTHSIPISSGKKGAQPASKKVRVLPRLVPTDTFWAEKEHQIEAALAQLEDPQYIKPTHLRFREDKRRPTVLRPGQAAGWTVELCNDGAQDRALSSVLLVPARQEFRLLKSYLYEDGAVLKRDSSLKFNIEFKPREPYRYGILRCLLIVSGRNFSLHHYIKVEVRQSVGHFHRRLADNPHQKYNVRFAFNRLMLRMQHRAVDKADIKLVWPEAAIDLRAVMQQQSKPNARAAASKSSTALQVSDMSDHINWFDQGVSQNKEQALAVREVVKRNYGDKSQPMLLFGAFGTGKTRTLVGAQADHYSPSIGRKDPHLRTVQQRRRCVCAASCRVLGTGHDHPISPLRPSQAGWFGADLGRAVYVLQ